MAGSAPGAELTSIRKSSLPNWLASRRFYPLPKPRQAPRFKESLSIRINSAGNQQQARVLRKTLKVLLWLHFRGCPDTLKCRGILYTSPTHQRISETDETW